MTIMLVDDNALMQQAISRFLTSQGFTTLVAVDGADALQQARESEFNLFLIDLNLPDQDGAHLLGQLRRLAGYQQVPAIAISGLGEMQRYEYLRYGFDDYLAKPIDLDELLVMVKRFTSEPRAVGLKDR